MSTYVISDIHGCYDEFIKILDVIGFSAKDELILAGDYVDRGIQTYEMLRWLENKPGNVIAIKGNHDFEFASYIKLMKQAAEENGFKIDYNDVESVFELYKITQEKIPIFDYYGTLGLLVDWPYDTTMTDLENWGKMLDEMPCFIKRKVNDKTVIIVHAGYTERLEKINPKDCEYPYENLEEFCLYAREDAYVYGGIKNGIIIAGHTPTISENEIVYNDGKIYKFYDEEEDCKFFDIDCGCVFRKNRSNSHLAALRLEDEEEFYVEGCMFEE